MRRSTLPDQARFDAAATELGFPSMLDTPSILIDRELRIRAVNEAYSTATFRESDEVVGLGMFDAFPDNPDDADGYTDSVAASVESALRHGRIDRMPVQRYDLIDPTAPEIFVPKAWSIKHTPLFDHGELLGVIQHARELTGSEQIAAAVREAISAGQAAPEAGALVRTLVAVETAERHLLEEQNVSLTAEVANLRRALEARDVIGQAKGMAMERFTVDADEAFTLLVRLSQQMNVPLAEVAKRLASTECHPD